MKAHIKGIVDEELPDSISSGKESHPLFQRLADFKTPDHQIRLGEDATGSIASIGSALYEPGFKASDIERISMAVREELEMACKQEELVVMINAAATSIELDPEFAVFFIPDTHIAGAYSPQGNCILIDVSVLIPHSHQKAQPGCLIHELGHMVADKVFAHTSRIMPQLKKEFSKLLSEVNEERFNGMDESIPITNVARDKLILSPENYSEQEIALEHIARIGQSIYLANLLDSKSDDPSARKNFLYLTEHIIPDSYRFYSTTMMHRYKEYIAKKELLLEAIDLASDIASEVIRGNPQLEQNRLRNIDRYSEMVLFFKDSLVDKILETAKSLGKERPGESYHKVVKEAVGLHQDEIRSFRKQFIDSDEFHKRLKDAITRSLINAMSKEELERIMSNPDKKLRFQRYVKDYIAQEISSLENPTFATVCDKMLDEGQEKRKIMRRIFEKTLEFLKEERSQGFAASVTEKRTKKEESEKGRGL